MKPARVKSAWTRRIPAAVAVLGLVMVFVLAACVLWPLPQGLTSRSTGSGVQLLDRHGQLLRSTRAEDGSRQQWTPLDQMDPDVIAAFLAVEDHRFYQHLGVDLRSAGRALRENWRGGKVVSGASTITMQLARIYFGTPRSWTGKAVQVLQAFRLEAHLSKQTILEQYLNRVPLGQGTVGVPAAADLYFGRAPSELSIGQAALLAGLARSPSSNNPMISLARAKQRRAIGLRRLEVTRFATHADVIRAEEEPVLVTRNGAPFLAPHFTSHLLAWEEANQSLATGNRRTSIDLGLQSEIESEVRQTVEQLKDEGGRQAAAVVLSNATGEILAWVGSPDFWADTSGQVDMVVSPRQPGSALKPFVYGLAFDRGFTAASVLPDIAQTYATSAGPYRPRNYDRRFHGPVRAREALASSYNIPAVELTDRLSAAALLRTLHDAGFESLRHSPAYYGLGLALGNGDVTLLELANGYRALANGGTWSPYTWRYLGNSHGAATGSTRRVMTERSAALVLDILEDPVARIPGFGLLTPFDFPFPVAAKTGTSRHFTDNWAVGTTGNFTVAVWVGDFSGRPMNRVSGVTGAGPLLHRAIMLTAQRYLPGALPTPEAAGAVPATICLLSGLRAGPRCPHTVEWFAPGTVPEHECDWHRAGGVVLPAMYGEWSQQASLAALTYATDHSPESPGVEPFRIVSPVSGDRYQVPPGVEPRYATIALRTAGGAGLGKVRWLVNGKPTSNLRWMLVAGRHAFIAERSSGERDSVVINVSGE
ncbi:MAG: penicillin-binding protein 1C [Gemmatimonadota bacterium]